MRLRGYVSAAEIAFLLIAGLLYVLQSLIPVHWLPTVCFIVAVAVKAIGMPAQIHQIARVRSVAGLSLANNILNYDSYLLWWIYGMSIHNWVLIWGMAPGALLTGIITYLNVRMGNFRWAPKVNSFGHYPGDMNCRVCAWDIISCACGGLLHVTETIPGTKPRKDEVEQPQVLIRRCDKCYRNHVRSVDLWWRQMSEIEGGTG